MNKKIVVILLITMVAVVAFSGCTAPTGGEENPTPTPAQPQNNANPESIPMPQSPGQGNEPPELPL